MTLPPTSPPSSGHPPARRERPRFAMPRPVPSGLWRRVPPAVFPPLLGALGLSLGWLGAVTAFALPPGLAQLLAGVIVALAAFAMLAYGAKLARRPGVLADDLAVLPGRAGVAAGVLSVYLLAAIISVVVDRGIGRALLVGGLALHAVFAAVLIRVLLQGPPQQRIVAPAWHLAFTGLIVAARAALVVDWPAVAAWLVWPSAVAAAAIYALSLRQAGAARIPAPLRPMLAIHLAPLALFATVMTGLGWTAAGVAFAWAALAVMVVLIARARWLLADGFSPLWGALTFPFASTAAAWVALWHAHPTEANRLIAGVLIVVATLIVIPILALTLRAWAQGRLSVRTNAAIA